MDSGSRRLHRFRHLLAALHGALLVAIAGTPLPAIAARAADLPAFNWDVTYGTAGIVRMKSPYTPGAIGAPWGARLGILGNGGLVYQSSPFSWQTPMQLQRLDVNGRPVGPPLSWDSVVNAIGSPMLRMPDGRTLVGAMRNDVVRNGGTFSDAAVMRLDANGDPDRSFGNNGVATIPLSTTQSAGGGDMVAALASDERGRPIVAIASYSYVNGDAETMTVVRLDATGQVELKYDPIRGGDDGHSSRIVALYGNEVRLDIRSDAYYFGADGHRIAQPTWRDALLGYSACLCQHDTGWSYVGPLGSDLQVYAGIPNGNGRPGFSVDSVTNGGRAGSFITGIEFDSAKVTLAPMLMRANRNGSRVNIILDTPWGVGLWSAATNTTLAGGAAAQPSFEPPTPLVFPAIGSRLQILDIGEQPDGNLVVTTAPRDGSDFTMGYAAFRISTTGMPNVAVPVNVSTPGLPLNGAAVSAGSSSSSAASSVAATPTQASAATSTAVGKSGGGTLDSLGLAGLLVLLAFSAGRPCGRKR